MQNEESPGLPGGENTDTNYGAGSAPAGEWQKIGAASSARSPQMQAAEKRDRDAARWWCFVHAARHEPGLAQPRLPRQFSHRS